MALASTSKVQLSYIEEAVPGTTPAVGNPSNLRMTGESLAYAIQTESSSEINATRQVTDAVQVSAEASGGINLELSYREYDPFMEALLGGVFSADFGADGVKALTVDIDATAGTITDTGIDGFAGLVEGQWIGIASGANAGYYRIATHTDDVITVDTDTPLVSDQTAVLLSFSSARLTTGVAAQRSFTFQKYFSDVAQYFTYRGMCASKLDLSFETGSILKGSIAFMGMDSERAGTDFMPGVADASQAFGVMNAVSGVGTILLNNAVIANTYVKSAKISVDGKLRGQSAIGHLGNVGIGEGTFEISGELELYLADGAIYDQAIADTLVSIQLPVADVNNNGYAFIFNNAKFGVPTVQAGGKDNDVMMSVPFTALAPNSATDKMLMVDRFGVAAA